MHFKTAKFRTGYPVYDPELVRLVRGRGGMQPSITISGEVVPGETLTANLVRPVRDNLAHDGDDLFYELDELLANDLTWYINGVPVFGAHGTTFVVPYYVEPGDEITVGNSKVMSDPVFVIDDDDAEDYISRVEAADGWPLEVEVKGAMRRLFWRLKNTSAPIADSNWDALIAGTALLMAGPKSLEGALQPLYSGMPTPTNMNFVQSDYDRITGLKGRRGVTTIVSGLFNQNFPWLDCSFGFLQTEEDTSVGELSRMIFSASPPTNRGIFFLNTTNVAVVNGPGYITKFASGRGPGFFGATSPTTGDPAVNVGTIRFMGAGSGTEPNARVAFMWFAGATDLNEIDSIITEYMNTLQGPIAWEDPEVLDYVYRVEAADGQKLEHEVKFAMRDLIADLKASPAPIAANNWEAIKAGTGLLMAGPRTLAGVLVPLHRGMPTPTNVNFVQGDYSRTGGLFNSGAKYVVTNLQASANPATDCSLMTQVTEMGTTARACLIGSNLPERRLLRINDLLAEFMSAGPFNSRSISRLTGNYGWSRSSGTLLRTLIPEGAGDISSTGSSPSPDEPLLVFRQNSTGFIATNYRLSFASAGRAIDLTAMDASLTAYMAALNAALS